MHHEMASPSISSSMASPSRSSIASGSRSSSIASPSSSSSSADRAVMGLKEDLKPDALKPDFGVSAVSLASVRPAALSSASFVSSASRFVAPMNSARRLSLTSEVKTILALISDPPERRHLPSLPYV